MNRFLIRGAVAFATFVLGVACVSISAPKLRSCVIDFTDNQQSSPVRTIPPQTCEPVYDANRVKQLTREHDISDFPEPDDRDLFRAFQELPLYAMPDCVDEAYSLTFLPSFHPPVLVRVWRVGDQSFLAAKRLDRPPGYRFGNLKESNLRPLTDTEWREVTGRFGRANYWDLAETVNEPLMDDGAAWILDGWNLRNYHRVIRRIPNNDLAEISKRLIQLSRLDTAHDVYLP